MTDELLTVKSGHSTHFNHACHSEWNLSYYNVVEGPHGSLQMWNKFDPCVTQWCYSTNKHSLLLAECIFVKGRTKPVELLNEEAFLGTLLTSKAVTDCDLRKEEIPEIFPSAIVLLVKGKRRKDFKASYQAIAIWKGFCISEITWKQSVP